MIGHRCPIPSAEIMLRSPQYRDVPDRFINAIRHAFVLYLDDVEVSGSPDALAFGARFINRVVWRCDVFFAVLCWFRNTHDHLIGRFPPDLSAII
jgi:hypothetical protein